MANKAISADPPLPGAPLNSIVTECSVRLTPDSRLSTALHYWQLRVDSGPWRSEERKYANPTKAAGGGHKISPAWRFQRNNWLPVPSRTVPSASLHNSPSNTLITFVQPARRRCAALGPYLELQIIDMSALTSSRHSVTPSGRSAC